MTAAGNEADPFTLARFVTAQADTYARALEELRRGAKRSHWMWFIFPQITGLGTSTMARRYAIVSQAEAVAYLAHPLLGPRLVAVAEALLPHRDRSATEIMGSPDDVKLRSSMTLFDAVSGAHPAFSAVLEQFFGGVRDERTLAFLRGQ